MDSERQRMTVVVSSAEVVGKSLKELRLLAEFGVTVSRITRHDLEFVPRLSDPIAYGDALSVVGEPEDLESFAEYAGHRAETFDETDVISVGLGIIAGILLGMVSFGLGDASFSLGMAGGPLFVALVLAHFGHLGPVTGHIPRASRLLLTQIGLAFFLADAGVTAGSSLVPILKEYGIALGVAAMVVLAVPLGVGYIFGRYVLKLDLLSALGGICGGMTSTPGLGAITAKTSARAPVISYAAAYPVALIFMTIVAQVLVAVLDG
jgi:putative transport protein